MRLILNPGPRPRRMAAFGLTIAAVMASAGAVALADDPKPPPDSGEAVARALEEAWPDRPEWLDMYTDILQGSQLGPNDGWFRRAVAQTRFDWESTRKRLDRDGDGKIAR